jgi:putative Mn2+ efflux pump MntP
MFALVAVALSLGLSNFAASVGIGVAGTSGRMRVQVAIVFGAFEVGMPLVGLAVGRSVAHQLGSAAKWMGGGLLVAVGLYGLVATLRSGGPERTGPPRRGVHLVVAGLLSASTIWPSASPSALTTCRWWRLRS